MEEIFLRKVRDKELLPVANHSPLPEGVFERDSLPSGAKFVTLSFLNSDK